MALLLSFIPATTLIVIAYFVFYTSTRAEGALQRFGRYLSIWLVFLAGVVILGALFASILGIRGPMGGMMMGGIGQHMQRMEQMQEEQLSILRELGRD